MRERWPRTFAETRPASKRTLTDGHSRRISDISEEWERRGANHRRANRSDGHYVFPSLRPSTYTLTINAKGFALHTRKGDPGGRPERHRQRGLVAADLDGVGGSNGNAG